MKINNNINQISFKSVKYFNVPNNISKAFEKNPDVKRAIECFNVDVTYSLFKEGKNDYFSTLFVRVLDSKGKVGPIDSIMSYFGNGTKG